MHGSFTPDSAEKFLELMREAGYETSVLPASDGLQNFSELGINPGATQGDVWSGNVADFGEVRGEYIENYDYTRCVRPNGTAYGTGGTCRKGTPAEKKEYDVLSQLQSMLPEGEKIVTSSGKVFGSETEKKKPSATPTAQEITSMNRDDLYDGKAAFKPGTEGHQAYKNEIERRYKLVSGLKKRGMSDEKIEEAVWERVLPKVGGRGGSSGEIATAPVPPKPIKDPVPGILRSQAEVKGIIAERPETPNAIRDEMGRPLKLSSDRLKALSQEDLETEWNRAKTTSRKDSLRKEIDRREAEDKLGKLKSDLLETSNKIDEIVNSGGKVGRNDPLSKKLREQAAAIAELKKTNFSEGAEGSYDFTRCVRPDGSAYGTRGKCKKGTEAGAKEAAKASAPADRERSAAIDRISKEKRISPSKAGNEADRIRMKELNDEVKKFQSMADNAREAGFRDRAVAYSKRASDLIRERADLKTKLEADQKGTEAAKSEEPTKGRRRKPATPQEARDTWAKAEVAVKSAKANAAKVIKETKGDKSPAARDRRFAANQALDRAETASLKAQDKFHAATKRQSKAAMTPEQRQEERTAGK